MSTPRWRSTAHLTQAREPRLTAAKGGERENVRPQNFSCTLTYVYIYIYVCVCVHHIHAKSKLEGKNSRQCDLRL
jgi:hypothetical protein